MNWNKIILNNVWTWNKKGCVNEISVQSQAMRWPIQGQSSHSSLNRSGNGEIQSCDWALLRRLPNHLTRTIFAGVGSDDVSYLKWGNPYKGPAQTRSRHFRGRAWAERLDSGETIRGKTAAIKFPDIHLYFVEIRLSRNRETLLSQLSFEQNNCFRNLVNFLLEV